MEEFTIGEAGESCATCGKPTKAERVNVTIWLGGELNVIEEVPAWVCDDCSAEYFDSETQSRINRLTAAGFPRWQAQREIPVAVFTIYGDKAAKAVDERSESEEVY
jgi:YgiT-type zinc finger domain-containing protein